LSPVLEPDTETVDVFDAVTVNVPVLEILELCDCNKELECVEDTVDVFEEDTDLETVVVTVLVFDALEEPVNEADMEGVLDITEDPELDVDTVYILEPVIVPLIVLVRTFVFETDDVIEFTNVCFPTADNVGVIVDVFDDVGHLVDVEEVEGEPVTCIELVSEVVPRIVSVRFGVYV